MPEYTSPEQNPIELILMRQLASYLVIPVFIVDSRGALAFYNEAAEKLLGRSYEENDETVLDDWARRFRPTNEDGEVVPPEELPLVIASREGRAAYLSPLVIMGQDEVKRRIAISAFPLRGQQGRHIGAVAMFWEV